MYGQASCSCLQASCWCQPGRLSSTGGQPLQMLLPLHSTHRRCSAGQAALPKRLMSRGMPHSDQHLHMMACFRRQLQLKPSPAQAPLPRRPPDTGQAAPMSNGLQGRQLPVGAAVVAATEQSAPEPDGGYAALKVRTALYAIYMQGLCIHMPVRACVCRMYV